jgi:hypothetical protein
MARERDGVGRRSRAGADHHAAEWQIGCRICAHHAPTLLERQRGRLAGRAQHIEPVAAVAEQKARQLDRASAIRPAVIADRSRDRRYHAMQCRCRHHPVLGAHP